MIHQLELSLDYYAFQARMGLGPFWDGIDFSRSIEYPLVASKLQIQVGDSVLEVGGGRSSFGLYLAWRNSKANFVITDFEEAAVAMSEDFIPKLSLENLDLRLEDATALNMEGETFDKVVSVSVMEHISGDGDRRAMAEIGRVLKLGGAAIITVPYAPSFQFEEAGQFGHMRHYDAVGINERLIEPSGLSPADILYFNDEFSFGERVVYHPLPIGARLRDRLFRHVSVVAGPLLCKLHQEPPDRAGGALLVLRK